MATTHTLFAPPVLLRKAVNRAGRGWGWMPPRYYGMLYELGEKGLPKKAFVATDTCRIIYLPVGYDGPDAVVPYNLLKHLARAQAVHVADGLVAGVDLDDGEVKGEGVDCNVLKPEHVLRVCPECDAFGHVDVAAMWGALKQVYPDKNAPRVYIQDGFAQNERGDSARFGDFPLRVAVNSRYLRDVLSYAKSCRLKRLRVGWYHGADGWYERPLRFDYGEVGGVEVVMPMTVD